MLVALMNDDGGRGRMTSLAEQTDRQSVTIDHIYVRSTGGAVY